MSKEFYFKNLHPKSISTSNKFNQSNNNIHLRNRKNKSQEKINSQNSIKIQNNKYFHDTNEITNFNNRINEQSYNMDKNKNKYNKNNIISPSKNKFISISEFPEMNEDQIYDNLNYIRIIQTSMIEEPNKNPDKIKTVDANKYLNHENNSISTFNDLKLKLLDKKNKFNTPFVFYKNNNIDLQNSKKVEDEKNYQIKRYRYLKAFKYSFNPVVRRKNSKIIQQWWRSKINPKIDKRKKIIKIQSVFRGYITRKNLNDIIFISVIYQNFINKLQHALGNFVHRNYFPKRYYKKKYALEKIFPLKLKLFFRRWKQIKQRYNDKEKAAQFLFNHRDKKRYVLLVLKTYFDIWKLKCEQFRKNEDKNISMKNQNQKFCALAKLFNKIEKVGNKNAYNLSKDNIHKYLRYIYQNKYAKKLLYLYYKYNIQRYLKKYFDIWQKQTWKEKEKQLKLKILANEIKARIRKNDKDFIRNNLNNLRTKSNLQNINNLKRAKKEFLFPEGIRHINTCVRKNVIRLFFKDYIRKRNIKKKLFKIIQKLLMKYYINKWKKNINKLIYQDKCKYHLKIIISKYGHLSNNINLAKYFNRWRNKVFMNKYKDEKVNIYNEFCSSFKKYIMNKNEILSQHKHIFLKNKLKKYINLDSDIIKKKLIKCFNTYANNNLNLKLKKAFDKWKKYVQLCKLNELKAKNLATVSKLTKVIYNSKQLSKNLHEWKEKNNIMNINNKIKYKDNVNNLTNVLNILKNKRMKQFFNNLRTAKDRLMKQLILKNLINHYIKYRLLFYFNKYKINTIKIQNKYKLANIDKLNKLKDITSNKIKKQEKNNYGSLKKYLNKWYLISKLINIEKYNQFLMNIKNALSLINTIITQNALREPFEKIKYSAINENNIILRRLKKYFIKNDNNNLRRAFNKFLKNIHYESKNIMKSNIIYNLKLKYEQIYNRTLISKHFNKWKMINNIYKRERNNNTILLTKTIKKIMKKIKQKMFMNKMKQIKYQYDIQHFTERLLNIYENIEKRSLYKYLNKWKNSSKRLSLMINQREKGYNIIYKTLSKAYSYKKLEDVLVPLLIKNYKKRYGNEFLNKLKRLFFVKINSSYKVILKNDKISKRINFKFKKSIKPNYPVYNDINKTEDDEENKSFEENKSNIRPRLSRYKIPKLLNRRLSNYNKVEERILKNIIVSNNPDIKKDKFYNERLVPYLVNYLNELRQERLRLVFEYFKYVKRNNLFCKLLKSYTKKQNYYSKESLIKSLKRYKIREKLFYIIRKSIIRKFINKYLLETKKRNDLFILMYKMKVFKKINKKKRILRFIRIWRQYVKFLRDRAAQLERFEKNFSDIYDKLSDSIFVDIGDEKSVQTQVLSFLDKISHDGKNKLKNSLGVSQTSLTSYFSGKLINNDIMNVSNSNFTFNNDNESNISLIRSYNYNQEIDDKSVNNSNNNTSRKIKTTVFTKNSIKK